MAEPRPYSAASARLLDLIRQAERGELDPRKAAAAALSISRGALRQERNGVTKDGTPYSYADPRPEVALSGLLTALRITGQLERGTGERPLDPEAMRKAGLRVVAA